MNTTGWWILGYAVAGVVVLIAASLLIAINLLARRIVTQAAEVTRALDGAMRNTEPLFDVAMMNHALESVTRGLKRLAGAEGGADERGLLSRLAGAFGGRR
jgi:hypothetical protein